MRVAVYGASGYTGRLTAAELHRRNLDAVLVGRDRSRLAALPGAERRVAGLDDPAALAEAFGDCDVVINCAGPFVRWGAPVVAAAIAARCHYVDISGEQSFLAGALGHDDAARRAGVAVVPGANDDALPSDLLAHLVARRVAAEAGAVRELTIALTLASAGAPSRGTLRSALANLESFTSGGLSYADGRWVAGGAARTGTVTFPGDAGPTPMVKFALPAVVTVPRHVQAGYVEGVAPAGLVAGFTAVTEELVAGLPDDGPDADARRESRWTLVVDAAGTDGRVVRGVVSGPDAYGSTAVIAVESAHRLCTRPPDPGVLAPAQAFDPAGFLDALAPHGVRWSITPPRSRRVSPAPP